MTAMPGRIKDQKKSKIVAASREIPDGLMEKYRDQVRTLFEDKKTPVEPPLDPKRARNLRCMAIKGSSLEEMHEKTGIPQEKIWQVTHDIDTSQRFDGKHTPGGSTELDILEKLATRERARQIMNNGGDAKAASMQTGLPLPIVTKLGKPLTSIRSSLLPEKSPLDGQPYTEEVERIFRMYRTGKLQARSKDGPSLPQALSNFRMPQPAVSKPKKGRPPRPEGTQPAGKHYLPQAVKWVEENHEQTMEEHKDIGPLKAVYFHMFDGKTPKEISEETGIPQGRVLEILFNPKTEKAVLDASEKEITGDRRFYCFPDDPYEVKRNQARAHVFGGKILINSDGNYDQLLKKHVPKQLRNFVKIR